MWVPTYRIQEGYAALGLGVAVTGQPSLEAWRRASEEVESERVRRALEVRPGDRVLLFAGQYGPGYSEVLSNFISSMGDILTSDPSLVLILSHHPRTDGTVEREALGVAQLPRSEMAPEELSTMELAMVSEVVLTWMSTVGIQAAFMGKQVIYFSPGPEFDGDLMERGIAFRADPTTLGDLLKRALVEPKEPERIRRALVNAGYVVEADWVVSEFVKEAVAR